MKETVAVAEATEKVLPARVQDPSYGGVGPVALFLPSLGCRRKTATLGSVVLRFTVLTEV